MKYTINKFRKDYPNDDVCLDMIFKLRFAKMPCCPQCSQQTTFKRIVGRRCYQCSDKDCQYQLYPTAGTVFEKTKTSLVDWFYVIYLMTSTRNGVSGKEIQRQLGVTYKCAWRMGHQIRLLMANGGLEGMLSGVVEVDETYIGGKAQNKHKKVREAVNQNGKGVNSPKVAVMAMLERDGNIRTQIIPKATGAVLKPIINDNVKGGSVVITDGHRGYKGLDTSFEHSVVNHEQDEYVIGKMHTNTVEGYFSHLKRTIKGTHIHVSRKHMKKYVDECTFKYIHRSKGQEMFHTILSRVV
ncbi:IS1595 family transposase [Mucilaginibacter aquaedulcis]|uniref:IS1595 family transposase n=1 Tax=Mucilaginibacter aquaedulcis TaxID=1187081 RepID=UPI0025B3D247|nr:IS1595 family transposase [Mucilaginibacter aquaedulcis]MDN3551483.1 IS1595 family transposase [Mucilaginibacter aquaedulcis]